MEKRAGCQGLYECLGYHPDQLAGGARKACPQPTAVCAGSVAQRCNPEGFKILNCEPLGLGCSRDQCLSAQQAAYEDRKAAYPASRCNQYDYTGICAGDTPTVCESDEDQTGFDRVDPDSYKMRLAESSCDAAEGTKCVTDYKPDSSPKPNAPAVKSRAVCQGTGVPCLSDSLLGDRDGPIERNGNLLRRCAVGREQEPFDCSVIGSGVTCVQEPGVPPAFGDPHCGLARECTEGKSSCQGNILTVCNGGRTEQIDCHALGFARCEPLRREQAICASD